MKSLHKALILSLLAAILFLLLALSWTGTRTQAAALSANEITQISPENIEYKQYLPIISKAPPLPVSIGPVGGTITSVLIDPVDQNMVYAGSFGGGVLKTIDGGNNWFKSGTGMPANAAIQSLGLIPSARNIVFAGTHSDGLYRSTNYGDTWTKVGQLFGTNVVYAIGFDTIRPNVVYAATRVNSNLCGELYRSLDWGITWNFLLRSNFDNTCNDYWYDVDVSPWDSNVVYLPYHEHGIYRSINNAASFSPLLIGNGTARTVAFDTLSGRSFSGFAKGTTIFNSDNRGETWTPTGLVNVEALKIFLGPLAQDRQRVLVATLSHGVAFSDNKGISWSITALQNTVKMAYDVAASNTNPQRWYAGTHGAGLFISTNYGASWILAGTGVVASSISGLTTSPQLPGETIAAVYGQGIMTTADGGLTWEELNAGLDSTNVTSVYDLGGQLYASADTGVYQVDGATWQNLNMPRVDTPDLEAYLDYGSKIYPVDKPLAQAMLMSNQESLPSLQKDGILPGNTPVTKLATTGDHLYAGTAGDGLWVHDGQSWQPSAFEGQRIADLEFSPDGRQGLLAACAQADSCSVFNHSGSGWIELSNGLENLEVTDLLITSTGEFYASTPGGIYHFDQISGEWLLLMRSESHLTTISSDQEGSTLVAAGEGMAWYSLNRGETWHKIEGLNQDLTYTSALIADDGSLILGSNAGGAFKLELPKPYG